ncbi:hypothetical protein Pedsa_0286 [Pseudopedobacter saltans DSM 12145]|uniref:6-bladed beta-propeller n=1 Tax=Pseudopedobacter saltans (strain ATCC 51119 / DSM 12145 / JCM 21818 / CCUG 39354 / LMG 10337 / NBRC 100064 / NCIMB 13643) TaxID=762903 RepID=F0S4B4_PSESL|nr:6-bladed beta-propeller [Pseudopedobacter saltans]ADY50871.1 hypothetical protein Pedsa_0286 [Pseudopedobacter saltans DSM 12145]
MKRIVNYFLGISLLISNIACGDRNGNRTVKSTPITFEPYRQEVFLEDIADDFYYLPLGTTSNFFIQDINKLFFSDSTIIVADFRQQTIFVFDQDGVPKSRINRLGQGPGEYPQMADALFDEENGWVEVLSPKLKKIFSYDMEGKLMRERKILDGKKSGLRFAKQNDFYVFDRGTFPRGKDKNRLAIYSNEENMKFINSYLAIPPAIIGMGYAGGRAFDTNGDSLYYLPTLGDTIYSVSKEGVNAAYHLDVPKENQISRTLFGGKAFKDFAEYSSQIDSKWVDDPTWLLVNNQYVYFRYSYSSSMINLFYSKQSGKVKQFDLYKSRLNPEQRLMNALKAKRGDYFVTTIHPTQYVNLPEKIRNKLNDKSNPVLLLFKLKDF